MEIKELRVGNYVSPFGKGFDKIIYIDGVKETIKCENFAESKIYDFEPVKLTDEILAKFNNGKALQKYDTLILNDKVHFEMFDEGLFFTADTGCSLYRIEYLYELQNIVLMFSNYELEINL